MKHPLARPKSTLFDTWLCNNFLLTFLFSKVGPSILTSWFPPFAARSKKQDGAGAQFREVKIGTPGTFQDQGARYGWESVLSVSVVLSVTRRVNTCKHLGF